MTSGLASGHDASDAPIYPAYCFSASPTFNKWVKLTAADVHALRRERGFEGQDIYFHLNHPIRYVYLVGPIVAIEVLADGKFFILTLDDGSGATIELKVERIFTEQRCGKVQHNSLNHATRTNGKTQTAVNTTAEESVVSGKGEAIESGKTPPHLVPYTAETTSQGITIVSPCEDSNCYDAHGHVSIGKQIVDIGTIIKAKGRLQIWRDSFQLKLERAFIVQTTDDEAQVWSEYEVFVRTVLSSPWKLTGVEIRALEAAEDEKAREEQRQKQTEMKITAKRSEKKRLWEEKRKLQDKKLEKRRAKEAEVLNGNALDQKTQTYQGTGENRSNAPNVQATSTSRASLQRRSGKVRKGSATGRDHSTTDGCDTSTTSSSRRSLIDKTNLP